MAQLSAFYGSDVELILGGRVPKGGTARLNGGS